MSKEWFSEHIEEDPLMTRVKEGDIEAVRRCLDEGMSPEHQLHYRKWFLKELRSYSLSLLGTAVYAGQLEIVQLLVERGAQVKNQTFLLEAAIRGENPDVLQYLAEQGLRPGASRRELKSLFFCLERLESAAAEPFIPVIEKMNLPVEPYASEFLRSVASCGHISMIRYFLERGADINYHEADMVYPYACTPVTAAAYHGKSDAVRYLAEHGADITHQDKNGNRPYNLAVQNKDWELAAYLKGLEPPEWHNEKEKDRALKSYKLPAGLVERLKNGPLRLDFPEGEFVKWLEFFSYLDTVEMKWKRKKVLSLVAAMNDYDFKIVWYPRDKRLWFIDVEHDVFQPITTWEEFIQEPGKWVNYVFDVPTDDHEEERESPVMTAIKAGDIDQVRRYLDQGLSPDEPLPYCVWSLGAPNKTTMAPVRAAFLDGQEDIVRLLVERGARLDDPFDLFQAVLVGGNPSCLRYLIEEAGLRPNGEELTALVSSLPLTRNPSGFFPLIDQIWTDPDPELCSRNLYRAAVYGQLSVVQFFLERGADINYLADDRKKAFFLASTAVTEATRRGYTEIVRYLVEQGADISIPDRNGRRPYDLAVEAGDQELIDILRSAASPNEKS